MVEVADRYGREMIRVSKTAKSLINIIRRTRKLKTEGETIDFILSVYNIHHPSLETQIQEDMDSLKNHLSIDIEESNREEFQRTFHTTCSKLRKYRNDPAVMREVNQALTKIRGDGHGL